MNFDETAYSALLERIFALTPSVQAVGFAGGAYKPGLEGMRAFDERLGHPWKQFRCIHVAGTNGKGSVASMLASALAGGACSSAKGGPRDAGEPYSAGRRVASPSGQRVGLYTSPHLLDFRERMKVVTDSGWYMPAKEEVWEFFRTYLAAPAPGDTRPDAPGDSWELDTRGLSFFEITTGLAFWWFARQGVDWAVIEAGLGGRLDSTNIVTPELAVITSIGLDHCALLGSTRGAIAREKAGIFKPGVPALVAEEDFETAPVFREAAARIGAPLYFADSMDVFTPNEPRPVDCAESNPVETGILSRMDLRGPCQRENLHTVLAALSFLEILERTWTEKGRKLCRSLVLEGDLDRKRAKTVQVPGFGGGPGQKKAEYCAGPKSFETLIAAIERTAELTGLRGRWERLQQHPEVVCDIAHNPPALEINFARLRELQEGIGAEGTGGSGGVKGQARPLIIVYGIMADKDLDGIAPLMPEGASYILAAPAIPRALPAEELRARLAELRPDLALETAPSVAAAVERALETARNAGRNTAGAGEPFIYIGGSTFVVTEAIEFFNSRQK